MEFEILEIRVNPEDIFAGKIAFLNLKGTPIDPFQPIWIWQWDENITVKKGKTCPLAFRIKEPRKKEKEEPARLKVALRVKGMKAGESYQLNGYLIDGNSSLIPSSLIPEPLHMFRGVFKIPGNDKNKEGDFHMLEVTVSTLITPEDFNELSGNFAWVITRGDSSTIALVVPCHPASFTYLELYWLYDAVNYSIFRKGIPVEILRYAATFYHAFKLSSIEDKTGGSHQDTSSKEKIKDIIIKYVVKACFSRNPPSYATEDTSCYFTSWSKGAAVIYLGDYLNAIDDINAVCNCFDQAALLQVFLMAVGIADVNCCYMTPFGYMKSAYLVGIGLCNNPAFKQENLLKVVDPMWGDRSYFTQHAFCRRDKKWILDTCVGPHTGSEKLEGYIKNAIDHFHIQNEGVTGTQEDFGELKGVTMVDYLVSIISEKELDRKLYRVDEFKYIINFPGKVKEEEKHYVVCSWPDPRTCAELGAGWNMLFEKTTAGDEEVMQTWKLQKRAESVHIKIHVSGKTNYAINRFLSIGSMTTFPELPYEKGPSYLGRFSAECVSNKCSRHFWVPEDGGIPTNIVFEVTTANVSFNVKNLHKWLNDLALAHIKSNLAGYLPSMKDITIYRQFEPGSAPGEDSPGGDLPLDNSRQSIKLEVGNRLIFSTNTPGNIFLDFRFLEGDGLHITGQKEKTLEFIALKESVNKFRLTAVDKNTLLSNTGDYVINVKSKPG